jgi:hypothetical protein
MGNRRQAAPRETKSGHGIIGGITAWSVLVFSWAWDEIRGQLFSRFVESVHRRWDVNPLHVIEVACLIWLTHRDWKSAKEEGRKPLLMPWILVWLFVAASILRSIPQTHSWLLEKKEALNGYANPIETGWITTSGRDSFFNLAGNLPKPPRPIIIALSSRRQETREGAEEMLELLSRAYGDANVDPRFRYDISHYRNPDFPEHKFVVCYNSNVKKNDPTWIAAKALENAMKMLNTSGSHSNDLRDGEICVYVEELNPKKK